MIASIYVTALTARYKIVSTAKGRQGIVQGKIQATASLTVCDSPLIKEGNPLKKQGLTVVTQGGCCRFAYKDVVSIHITCISMGHLITLLVPSEV